MSPDPRDVSSKEAVTKAGRKARRLERQSEDCLVKLLNMVEGRWFLWDLLETCGVFESSFTGNNTTFFLEGQRNIGLVLVNAIHEVSPDAYSLMVKEAKDREEENNG